jgi:CheY-like chemotaxis protein
MSSRNLLCVDDRPESLQLRKTNLERFGFAVFTATSTTTALAKLEELRVAAVLLEYKVEGMDAEAVAHHIKQRFPNQPIILLSAYSEMPERILWLVDEYVMRSEPVERLAQVIERVSHPAGKSPPRSDKTARTLGHVAS